MPNNSKRDIELFIVDTFVSIYKIKQYTKPFSDGYSLQSNILHWDATMRAFELIGESLNILLDNESFKSLAPAYFRKIVNFRNVIVHGYFGISADEVWDIIVNKLDDLNNDLLQIVHENYNLSEAINSTIKEYEAFNEKEIVKYLKGIK